MRSVPELRFRASSSHLSGIQSQAPTQNTQQLIYHRTKTGAVMKSSSVGICDFLLLSIMLLLLLETSTVTAAAAGSLPCDTFLQCYDPLGCYAAISSNGTIVYSASAFQGCSFQVGQNQVTIEGPVDSLSIPISMDTYGTVVIPAATKDIAFCYVIKGFTYIGQLYNECSGAE